jgi:transcriptional regulator with XRE-family HTH domain
MQQPEIADNLKAIRAKLNLSLSQVATLTQVSKAMLGQIERGESSPTIATLWKIAKGLKLPLTSFLQGKPTNTEFIQFRNGLRFKTIFSFDAKLGSEMYLQYLEPQQIHQSAAHEKGVVEDIIVLNGQIEILHNTEWQMLKTGDALRFAADQPHGYRNFTNHEASFHNIMHYPAKS